MGPSLQVKRGDCVRQSLCSHFNLAGSSSVTKPIMADTMDLDPQLREFLVKSNMLNTTEDGSGLPIQQLRQSVEGPYKYELPAHRCCCYVYTHCPVLQGADVCQAYHKYNWGCDNHRCYLYVTGI